MTNTTSRARASPNHATPIQLNTTQAHHQQLDGRDHLVVPVIGIVEGVLNGELVLRQEFAHHVESWNGRPVTLRHPDEGGIAVSANSPSSIEVFQIGQLFDAHLDGDRLKADLWIDVGKAQALGPEGLDVLTRLEAGTATEVSTGYFRDVDPSPGEWGGVPYVSVARNIKPDHIAILPDQVGACSLDDGCGTPRTNEQEGGLMPERKSFRTRIRALFDRVRANNEQAETFDVLEEAITQAYEEDPGPEPASEVEAIAPLSDPIEEVEAAPSPQVENPPMEEPMQTNERVEALINNEVTLFEEGDREWLETLPEDALTKLEPAEAIEVTPSIPATPEVEAPATTEQLDVDGVVAQLGVIGTPEAAEFIQNAVVAQQQHRASLVQNLTQHAGFAEADLSPIGTPMLEQMWDRYEPADYSGRGVPTSRQALQSNADEGVPPPPNIVTPDPKAEVN